MMSAPIDAAAETLPRQPTIWKPRVSAHPRQTPPDTPSPIFRMQRAAMWLFDGMSTPVILMICDSSCGAALMTSSRILISLSFLSLVSTCGESENADLAGHQCWGNDAAQ